MFHKPQNKKLCFLHDITNYNDWNLPGLVFETPKTLLTKHSKNIWESFGVRDPAPLVDANGYPVKKDGYYYIYYTSSAYPNGRQQYVSCIRSKNKMQWERFLDHPVLSPSSNGWDSGLTSTPWCIKNSDGTVTLYYRGASAPFKDDSIGITTSKDGISFKNAKQPSLTPNDFQGMKKDKVMMGVTHVTRTLSGDFLLSFEAFSKTHGGVAAIFGATSSDGINFTPFNNGMAYFSKDNVTEWPVSRVANPRITTLPEYKTHLLLYNGYDKNGEYGLAMACSEDLINWTDYPANPVLMPSSKPVNSPFSGRLEGGVLDKNHFETATNEKVNMFFMAIPKKGPSHKNCVLAESEAKKVQKIPVYACINPHNITINDNNCSLLAGKKTEPTTKISYFCSSDIQSIEFTIHANNSALIVSIGSENDDLYSQNNQVLFTIKNNKVYVYTKRFIPNNKLLRKLSKTPALLWQKTKSIKHTNRIKISFDHRSKAIILNKTKVYLKNTSTNGDYFVLSYHAVSGACGIKDLYFK